jgi:hypothetical protein
MATRTSLDAGQFLKGTIVLAGTCLLILIVVTLVKMPQATRKRPPETLSPEESRYTPSLSIAEAALDPHSRTIRGIVENRTEKTIDDVQVSYEVRDFHGELMGVPVVKIGSLKPHQSFRFETGKLPASVTQFDMHSLLGTPR